MYPKKRSHGSVWHAFGTAFHLIDDILDYSGNNSDIGKNRDDLAEGKPTLPLIYAIKTVRNIRLIFNVEDEGQTVSTHLGHHPTNRCFGYAKIALNRRPRQQLQLFNSYRNPRIKNATDLANFTPNLNTVT
jgi:geranylgeranyl pyrophosphate synthase